MLSTLAAAEFLYYIRNMSNNETKDAQRLANIFNALSNPNRLRIVMDHMAESRREERWDSIAEVRTTMRDVGAALGLAPSTVSHHIKELRQAGLLEIKRDGQRMICRINDETIAELAEFFNGRH